MASVMRSMSTLNKDVSGTPVKLATMDKAPHQVRRVASCGVRERVHGKNERLPINRLDESRAHERSPFVHVVEVLACRACEPEEDDCERSCERPAPLCGLACVGGRVRLQEQYDSVHHDRLDSLRERAQGARSDGTE